MSSISFRILSWNLHGLPWPITKDPAGRIDRAGAKIREVSPEVILLQEAWRAGDAARLSRALHPDWIRISLTRRNGAPRGGLLAFVRATGWAISSPPRFEPFNASAPAWKIWEGDGLGGKGALIFRLECAGQPIAFVDTHLQSQYPGSDYCAIREAQISQLGRVIAPLDRSIPLVIAGDFNTDSREPLYSLLAALGTDLTAQARRGSRRGTNFDLHDGEPDWIDYIFAAHRENWSTAAELELILNHGRDDPYSDHHALLATLTLTPAS